MATPYRIHVVPENTGLWRIAQTEAAAGKATELLQRDLKEHHVYFNDDGFHNHIVHHVLALYGTGAQAQHMQKGYDGNASYQRPAMAPHPKVPEEMVNWDQAKKYLGKEEYYADFLAFFQREIERTSWQDVLKEYVFKGDERADDMLVRLFSGFVHPLIQLMYGMEWEQPAIVAQALAQASVHGDEIKVLLFESERLSRQTEEMPSIISLYDAVARDEKLVASIRMKDANKLTKGVLVRARDEMISMAAKVRVKPEELDERTAEMFNACVYAAASAAAHPTKHVKFDFFLIHHINVSPIFLTINAQPWIPTEAKVRILEWKIRMDLAQYTARGVPPLSIDRISSYRPKPTPAAATGGDGDQRITGVISRLHVFEDDGHAIKLGRAVAICQAVSEKYEDGDKGRMPLKGKDNWTKVQHMIADSVEGTGVNWVQTTGLEEAWKDIEDAPKL